MIVLSLNLICCVYLSFSARHDTLLSGLQETISKLNQDVAVLRATNEFLENQRDQLRISCVVR